MDVIAMESEAFNELIKRIKRIESFIERSSAVLQSIDEELEMTTFDVMQTLNVSKSTLYRWRKKQMIQYRFTESGDVRYSYKSLYNSIRGNYLRITGLTIEECLTNMNNYKDNIILCCCSNKLQPKEE